MAEALLQTFDLLIGKTGHRVEQAVKEVLVRLGFAGQGGAVGAPGQFKEAGAPSAAWYCP